MKQLLQFGLGGFVGSVARSHLGGLVFHHAVESLFLMKRGESQTGRGHFFGARNLFRFNGARSRAVGLCAAHFRFEWRSGLKSALLWLRVRRAPSHAALNVLCGLVVVWLGFKLMGGDHGA